MHGGGRWGERAGWSRQAKLDYLSRVCKSQWHAILIKLFESPQILGKFEQLFDDLNKKQNYYEILIAILILSVLGRVPTLEILVDLAGPRVLETGFKRDSAIREMIDFNSGEVRLRSSVAGEFILKRIADPNATVQTLISLAKAAHKLKAVSLYYSDMLRVLSRFGNLQTLLPEAGRGKAILHYYETIKVFDFYQTNPLFWLQYAIACLFFEDFDRADKYFDAAYSFAKKMQSYDSYQIDNHYARYLLMRAIHSGDASKCMADFRNARTIILTQMQKERLYYPFRVATALLQFYQAFAPSLNDDQKNEIVRLAKTISDRIAKLPELQQRNRYVASCWKSMQVILQAQNSP